MVCALAADARAGVASAEMSRRFHDSMAELVRAVCVELRAASGVDTVALSGGVFANAVLLEATCARLRDARFRVLRHGLVPPNDGGLAFGQLAVAAAQSP